MYWLMYRWMLSGVLGFMCIWMPNQLHGRLQDCLFE